MNKVDLTRLANYTEDFALWSAEQAALVRAGKLDRVDLENIAEEIESLGRSEEHQIDNRLEVLIAHLLKRHFQPAMRKHGWKSSIVEQRIRLARLLGRSWSLKSYPAESLPGSYIIGRNDAIAETMLPGPTFPETCPHSIEQILDADFLPSDT